MRLSKTALEILEHLHPTKWKSAIELKNEIKETRQSRGKSFLIFLVSIFSSEWADFLSTPNSGSIYIALEQLTSQHLAEERWRNDPPEVIKMRGGNRSLEWRLTEAGLHIRSLQPQPEEDIDDELVPRPA